MKDDQSIPDDPQFQNLLAACLETLQRGECVDRERLRQEHPKHADSICDFLDHQQLLQHAMAGMRPGFNTNRAIDSQFDVTVDSQGVPEPVRFSIGDHLKYVGEYEILDEVARGGMGIVFKARQEKLRRTVALKMILAGRLATDADVDRFHREARAAAALSHPHIVGVHEVGRHDGHHYFTMDFVDGRSLAQQLSDGSLPPRNAAQLIKTVAEAIHYAHERGVLHRDLKPGNVLIDTHGRPHVTDFGLAKTLYEGEGTLNDLTATGQILGTPGYMSPEQAAAKNQLVCVASDVYSLGAVLYACLSGRAPFLADSPVDTLKQVIEKEPVPLRMLSPQVPRDLETICLKCLQKEPHRRYATAQELADDLGHFLAGRPILAKPIGSLTHAWKWCKRRPDVATLLGTLAAAVLIGFLAVSFWWREAERAREQSEIKSIEAQQNLYASLMREAETLRLARRSGYRDEVWSRLRDASQLADVRVDSDLIREQAVACLGDFVGVKPITIAGPALEGSNDCAVFLDDDRIAVALAGGDVSVRDLGSGEERSHIFREGSTGRGLASVAGGSSLVIADTNQLERWDRLNTGVWVQRWRVPAKFRSLFMDLSVLPDSVVVIDRFEIHILNIDDGQIQRVLSPPKQYEFLHKQMGFLTVAASPDGKFVAAADTPASVFVWETSTGKLAKRIDAPTTGIPNLKFTADGQFLVLGSDQGIVTFRCSDFSQWSVFRMDPVRSIDTSPDGRHLLIQTQSGSVQLWNLVTQRLLAVLSHPSSALTFGSSNFSPSGEQMLSAGASKIRVWKFNGTREKLVLAGHTQAVRCVEFHPRAAVLASGSHDGTVTFWNSLSGELLKSLELGEQVQAIAYSPDASLFAAVTTESLRLWRTSETGRASVAYHNHGHKAFEDVCFSPDGKWLATCGNRGTQVWKVLAAQPGEPPALALESQQSLLGKSIVFDSSSQSVAVNAPRHFGWFRLGGTANDTHIISKRCFASNLAVGRREATVIAVADKGSVQAWDLRSQSVLKEIADNRPLGASIVAVSPSGKLVAANASPSAVGLFDFDIDQRIFSLADERAAISDLAWEPSGRRLAVGLSDGSVAIWDIAESVGQLRAANLAGDLKLFADEFPVRYDINAVDSFDQNWQLSGESVTVEDRSNQILAQWNIAADTANDPSFSSDAVARGLQGAHGGFSPSGAYALTLPLGELESVDEALQRAGYRPQSLRPYRQRNQWLVAACWQPIDGDAKYLLGLSKEQVLAEQKEMLLKGYQLVDLGGYPDGSEGSGESFYAVWQQHPSEAQNQVIVVGVEPEQTHRNFEDFQNDYEPVLRQPYFTAAGEKRFCEVWEEFGTPVLDPWFACSNDTANIRGRIREFAQLPARYLHVTAAPDGQDSYCSSVWRSDAASLETHYLWDEPLELVHRVSLKMLRAGYRPRNVCVAVSDFTDPVAAAIWERDRQSP